MSLALSLCQYVLRPKRGLAQASPGLAWLRPGLAEPRSASIAGLHQHNRKGKIVMIKTRRYKRLVFGFVFCTWNWYDFWRRSWGLPWKLGLVWMQQPLLLLKTQNHCKLQRFALCFTVRYTAPCAFHCAFHCVSQRGAYFTAVAVRLQGPRQVNFAGLK